MKYRQSETNAAVFLEPETSADASVIWLHGLGADGHDFVPIVPELELPAGLAVRFVFPHAPIRAVTINNGMRMRAWYDILALSGAARQDEGGIRESSATLDEFIARERERGVPGRRVVIAGFSQGGAIALHAGLRYPERLAGIMALSTYLPLPSRLAEEASTANRDLPILMCHGTADPVLPVQMGEASRDDLLAAGYPVEWKAYPMQHQVSLTEIGDISAWLTRQLAGTDQTGTRLKPRSPA
jgi:phospholipase/carboxylesterase